MNRHDTAAVEHAVLAVLSGKPIEDAAAAAGTSPGRLADAVERYRAGGRGALDTQPAGWHQVLVQFADYAGAADAFRVYLLPAMSGGPIGAWWFVRKHPHWRLRVHPGPDATVEDAIEHIASALDAAVSWGVATDWRAALYEPETVAFGGPHGMHLAHALFHTDSVGVLHYLHHTDAAGLPDGKSTSLLVTTLMLRAAGLEWGEQGAVWSNVEEHRPLPDDVRPDQVSGMAGTLRRFLMIDAGPALADGPLTPLRDWVEGMEQRGRDLGDAAYRGQLQLGLRSVLARHVLFHWNRMGFTARQQAIWARAAREAVLGQ